MAELTAGLVAEGAATGTGPSTTIARAAPRPQHTDLALRLGKLLHRRGRRDEAAEAHLAAARSSPTDVRARHGLGRLGLPVVGGGVALVIKHQVGSAR